MKQRLAIAAALLAPRDLIILAQKRGPEVVEEEGLILSISENGFGKRTPLEDYRLTARGGKGVINMKLAPRIGKVVAILSVKEDTDLMIITRDGKIIRLESGEIRQAGRSTQGVRLVRMEDDDQEAMDIKAEVAGVNSDGLIIARLPAASTPANGAKVRFTGKFQGLIMPTTPLGW